MFILRDCKIRARPCNLLHILGSIHVFASLPRIFPKNLLSARNYSTECGILEMLEMQYILVNLGITFSSVDNYL